MLCRRVSTRLARARLLALLLCGSAWTGAWGATTYYVDRNNGQASDTNPGTQNAPWRTIAKAASTMGAGDTAMVLAGTYNEKVNSVRSGSAGNPITFRAQGNVITKTFNVDHHYITIDGFEMTNALEGYMMTITGSNCQILNNVIHDTGARWGIIHISNGSSTGCLIKGNRYYAATGPGDDLTVIILNGSNHLAEGNEIGPSKDIDAFRVWGTNNVIRGNYIHDASTTAGSRAHMDVIQSFGHGGATSRNIVFEKNVIVNFDGQICMTEFNGSANMRDWDVRNNIYVNVGLQANIGIPYFRFYNNTLYNVGSANSLIMYLYDAAGKSNYSNAEIRNNLFVPSSRISGYWQVMSVGSTGSGVVISNNYIALSGTYGTVSGFNDASGINGGNPQFVDPANNNFRLQASSPAINRGRALSGFADDYDGTARPQGASWDIGAFEYGSSGTPTPLPAPRNLRIPP